VVVQYIKFFYLTLLFFFAIFHHAEAQQLSNLDFLANLTDSLLEEISKEAFPESLREVRIRSLNTNEDIRWFIENQIFNVLKKARVSSIYLKQQQDETDSTKYTVYECKVLTLGIEYMNKMPGGNLSPGNIRRKGSVGLSLRIFNHPSGEILWSGIVKGSRSDWIPGKKIREVENRSLPFTMGVFLNGEGKSGLLEPIVITAVTGIIIFLFYSLRSR
jgi:hypothetical protein